MGIDDKLIEEIVRRVRSVTTPDRVILFGSAATGEMTRDSDIDLLILKPRIDNDRDEWLIVRRALRGLGFPFDIILMKTDRFEETKNCVGGIAFPANKHGRIIYAAA